MTDEDDAIREFGSLSNDEKKELLRRLVEDLDQAPGAVDDFGISGEVTVRVLDDDGEEKTRETESFKY